MYNTRGDRVAKRPRTTKVDDSMGSAMTSDDIVEVVQDIVTTTSMVRSAQVSKDLNVVKYPEFAKAFPVLFASACEPGFDIGRFMYMIQMRNEVKNEKRTMEDASKEVGQSLFDEYVKPIMNNS
jgi:hypothetical protein